MAVLYRGVFDVDVIKALYAGKSVYNDSDCQEGYVVRLAQAIPFTSYKKSICKFVRENHVQTNANWMMQAVIRNGLL